ncbi:uncharacterized protein LOC105835450 [Monomorium pharaonis]|uniref:uncharacterized protein LOC105835450 n=1 Tax=Monomorium pharaonis TaxID=307658 RepID=UPI00102E1D7B|nr:uncharacterized protein LOC105835450 [Monomorium pharaonis]
MKHLLLSMILPYVAAEMCIGLLRNRAETRKIRRRPGHISLWNAITGEFEQLEALKSNNTAFCSVNAVNDLRGKTLVVATDSMHPYVIINGNEVTGIIGDIWTILEETLKFKTIYRRARRTIVATLMNGDTHALLIATAMYIYPSSHYAYSVPFTTNSYALFVQSDGAIDTKWWYVNIFSRGLWLAFFASIICIACSIVGIYRIKKFVYADYGECDDELSSLSFNLLYVLGGQGFQKVPKSFSLRLIILSSLVMGMLVSCGFSSTLTSCLANKGNSVSLTNLNDVVLKRTHSLCIRNDSTAYVHFTVDGLPEGDLQDDWKELLNHDCPDMRDSEAVAAKLCSPGFAYFEAPAVFLPVYRKVEHECDIVQLPDNYWSVRLAFLHARASQHRKLIDNYLMRMRSAGILSYLEKKWISQQTYSQSSYLQSNSFQPVEYMHVRLTTGLFYIMVTISIFICILENIWYKHAQKLKRNSNSILLGTRDNSVMKARYKIRSRLERRRRLSLIFLSESIKNPEFLQNVKVRIN